MFSGLVGARGDDSMNKQTHLSFCVEFDAGKLSSL